VRSPTITRGPARPTAPHGARVAAATRRSGGERAPTRVDTHPLSSHYNQPRSIRPSSTNSPEPRRRTGAQKTRDGWNQRQSTCQTIPAPWNAHSRSSQQAVEQSPPESPNEHPTKHRAITAKATDKPLRETWSDHGLSDQHSSAARALTGGGRAARKSKTRFKGPEGLSGSPGDQKYLGGA
jgi:hypothetical protein